MIPLEIWLSLPKVDPTNPRRRRERTLFVFPLAKTSQAWDWGPLLWRQVQGLRGAGNGCRAALAAPGWRAERVLAPAVTGGNGMKLRSPGFRKPRVDTKMEGCPRIVVI